MGMDKAINGFYNRRNCNLQKFDFMKASFFRFLDINRFFGLYLNKVEKENNKHTRYLKVKR